MNDTLTYLQANMAAMPVLSAKITLNVKGRSPLAAKTAPSTVLPALQGGRSTAKQISMTGN
jgi:hypothetical protein